MTIIAGNNSFHVTKFWATVMSQLILNAHSFYRLRANWVELVYSMLKCMTKYLENRNDPLDLFAAAKGTQFFTLLSS